MNEWDTLTNDAAAIRLRLTDALREADRFSNPSYSPTGLQEAKEDLRANARADASTAIGPVVRRLQSMQSRAAVVSAPYLSSDAPTRDEWERVKMLLDSGRTLGDVIASATGPRLRAIVEWGPAFVEAQVSPKLDRAVDSSIYANAVRNDVLRRWAQLEPDGAAAKAILAEQAGRSVAAEIEAVNRYIAGRTPTANDTLALGYSAPRASSLDDVYDAISGGAHR